MHTSNRLFKTTLILIALVFSMVAGKVSAQSMPTIPANQLKIAPGTHEIKFTWQGDSSGSNQEPYRALLIAVKLPSCPRIFYMQFDTGSPYSLFYKNKLGEIQQKYPAGMQLADTTKVLTNFSFKVGDVPVTAGEIVLQQQSGDPINWNNKKSIDIIGTLGTDFIDNRMVLVDYPRKRLLITTVGATALSPDYMLSDLVYAGRSIMFPVAIDKKRTMLYFDTGSSAFELLTDKQTVQKLGVPNATPVKSSSRSWNRTLTAYTVPTKDSIEIALHKIPINHVTYIEGASSAQVDQMMKMGMRGMTGNKLFINHILLLDTKNKKFALINSSQRNKLVREIKKS